MSVILCTAGYDHTIRFWEALSGLCSRQIPHTDSQINRLCISPNKQYLAVAGRSKIHLYSCRAPDSHSSHSSSAHLHRGHPSSSHHGQNTSSAQDGAQPLLTFEGHANNITGVAFHVDTKWMVTSSEDGTVKIWDVKTGSVQRNYNHGCPVNDVVIHPNQGELISCDRGGNVRIWDLSENKCSHQLIPEDDVSVASVTCATDGSLLCAGNNAGNVYVWRLLQTDTTTVLVPHCKFAAHNTYITRVLLSPDVRQLATCSADHTARIWKVDLSPEPEGSGGDEGAVDGTGDEGRADGRSGAGGPLTKTTSTDPALQHTHAQGQGPSVPPQPPPSHTSTAANRTTSTKAAAMTSSGRKPLNVNTFAHPQNPSSRFSKPTSTTGAHATPYGKHNQGLGEEKAFPLLSTLASHERWVWDCAFSADSAYLVTACSDHYARLWDLGEVPGGSVIRQYQGHHRGLVCCALNDYS